MTCPRASRASGRNGHGTRITSTATRSGRAASPAAATPVPSDRSRSPTIPTRRKRRSKSCSRCTPPLARNCASSTSDRWAISGGSSNPFSGPTRWRGCWLRPESRPLFSGKQAALCPVAESARSPKHRFSMSEQVVREQGNGGERPAAKQEEQPPKDPAKARRTRIRAAIVVAVLALAAFAWWLHARHFEDTDDAQVDGNITAVSSRVPGTVIAVHTDDNQQVK